MRKKRVYKKHYQADPVYNQINVGRFINYVMEDGKKSIAEKVFYKALDLVKEKAGQDGLAVFEKALDNVAPVVELSSRRIGGANYQIPIEVRPDRRFILACRWIIQAARSKKGMPMANRLAEEISAAYNNEGVAIKKKQDTHKMAEANRAFAHFARFTKKK
ncbi:MAG: 30S ribosomal protein S7 [Candidatus Liptonbacteria bacterium RIFOXYC1_FULL_36_8]|uniref:Small ribosomal subunit protein uS7 n=3 Tax=Candidatus Liptoniibacteriota TaxID=1817909 RepID=A0A1G2CPL6_9BACT|nr:MAG: 30S ribosomal protein S7 [Candidatus Liptonbacteria bacterium RIFOXYB1_FULL_36_10]OGZ04398.1 MAG: 30S ribosomal protein S7 [Candidatus Liptonbacteria bacterium RIFOXYC1_FULL_36_8]OGZ04577.1 MAG: 30S ribosomal protein S7 [Candidatus Liptonbacteria bacterium RIFOXYD1_FULL_36_11]